MLTDIHNQHDMDRMEAAFDLLYAIANGKKEWQPQFVGQKNDPTITGTTPPYAHGNGGLFAHSGVQPQLFATVMQSTQGVIRALPEMPAGSAVSPDSNYGGLDSPLFDTVTGVTAEGSVTEPVNICDDQPRGGLLKACTLTAPFGRFGRGFALDVWRPGQLRDRSEPTDLRLMNPVQSGGNPFQSPAGTPTGQGSQFMNDLTQRWMIAAVQLGRLMAPRTWTGNPTNNTAGNGYMEFPGLDLFIASGNKLDAITGTPCPSMDADIKNFSYNLVTGNTPSIVNYVDMVYRFLTYNAEGMGLDPATWIIAMRPELFDEIVKLWPVRYYEEFLNQMTAFTSGVLNVEAVNAANMRDDMRRNQYLPIRGERVGVVLDNSIAEANSTNNANLAAGQYASDIYFIPMTVLGGVPVTWWEFFNLANPTAEMIAQFGVGLSNTWTTDGGRFRWVRRERNGCFEFDFTTMPRIIMRTPFLAGRIQNVAYQPLQHTRDWQPTDAYFADGGRTNTPIGQYYTEWSTSTPTRIG